MFGSCFVICGTKCPFYVLQSPCSVFFFCHVAVIVLCLFLTVSWVGLWSVIVAFPKHTHLLLDFLMCFCDRRNVDHSVVAICDKTRNVYAKFVQVHT